MKRFLLLFLIVACNPVWAQDAATTNRATELKANSRVDSATLGTLPSGTAVKVLGRASGWARVQSGQLTGWLRAFHLRYESVVTEASESSSFGSFLGGLFGGNKKQATQQTATIGIRGLSEEEMQNAKPNPAEFARMKSYASSKSDAEAFARGSRLKPVDVAFVDANGKPVSGGTR